MHSTRYTFVYMFMLYIYIPWYVSLYLRINHKTETKRHLMKKLLISEIAFCVDELSVEAGSVKTWPEHSGHWRVKREHTQHCAHRRYLHHLHHLHYLHYLHYLHHLHYLHYLHSGPSLQRVNSSSGEVWCEVQPPGQRWGWCHAAGRVSSIHSVQPSRSSHALSPAASWWRAGRGRGRGRARRPSSACTPWPGADWSGAPPGTASPPRSPAWQRDNTVTITWQ